jgi:hypothetical protein
MSFDHSPQIPRTTPKLRFLRVVPLQNHLRHRSCRQHHIRPTIKFGLVHQNYGPTYQNVEFGVACHKKYSGGVRVTIGAKKIRRTLSSLESGSTG